MYTMNGPYLFEEELTPKFVKPTLISLSHKPPECWLTHPAMSLSLNTCVFKEHYTAGNSNQLHLSFPKYLSFPLSHQASFLFTYLTLGMWTVSGDRFLPMLYFVESPNCLHTVGQVPGPREHCECCLCH